MPILNTATKLLMKPLPRIISPSAHAAIDYMTVGSFFITAVWLWPRHKRASLAALICGGAELAIGVLTDYSGSSRKAISFQAHGKIDLGLAAMVSSMPEFLAFKDEQEKTLFLVHGAAIMAVQGLTEFPEEESDNAESVVDRRKEA